MPIYEYYCKKCQHEFEELVFGNDVPPCPKCGASQTEKLISRPCRHCSGEGGDHGADAGSGGGGRSGCAGCSGGNCATCH